MEVVRGFSPMVQQFQWNGFFRKLTNHLVFDIEQSTFHDIKRNLLLFEKRTKCGVWKQGRRGWSHEREREDQELKNRLCSHNIESEPRTQTFMLYAHPSPLCPSQWPKLPSHWRSTSPKTREAKMIFFANFVRFEKQPFPICACSKSCNSVITHPSARPHELFRIHVVLLEIPYPQMFFLRDEDVRLGTN